jgi:hypothetical protein
LKTVLALVLSAMSVTAFGQGSNSSSPKKIAIFFSCDCDDAVGALMATAFRDMLATSPRFTEAAGVENSAYNLSVVSLDPQRGNPGHLSAFSAVLLIGTSFMVTHSVRTCPQAEANSCAANLLSFVDKNIHRE